MRKPSLAFLFFILSAASFITISSNRVNAVQEDMQRASPSSEVSVDYALPYPGILPGHPLYPLKNFRDRLLDFLIKDPVKRVEYNLLMSDKRYAMGVYLTQKQEYDRSLQIVQEGEEYYGKITGEIRNAKDRERSLTADQFTTLQKAGEKHKNVLKEIQNESPDDMVKGYNKIAEEIDTNINTISGLRE